MDWLEDQGHGGLIKRTVSVAFNRDQENEAVKLMDELSSEFSGVSQDHKVESATIRAFIREQLEEGVDFPMDMFGAVQILESRIRTK